jgi:hypothetical protein
LTRRIVVLCVVGDPGSRSTSLVGDLDVVLLKLVLGLEGVFVSAAAVEERGLEWRALGKAYYLDRGAAKEATGFGWVYHVSIHPVKTNASCNYYYLLTCLL